MLFHQLLLASLAAVATAESGIDGWLRYKKLPDDVVGEFHPPRHLTVLSCSSRIVANAASELQDGIHGLFERTVHRRPQGCGGPSSIVIGTAKDYSKACGRHHAEVSHLEEDGYWLSVDNGSVRIIGQNARGALYGAYRYLSMLSQGNFSSTSYISNPSSPLRWTNEWDNMDGSIERGYGGKSVFFADGTILPDLDRAAQYARLLSSLGINGVILTNVNADAKTLTLGNIKGLGRIADIFRPWGIPVGIALKFDAPQSLGGLPTSDPLDPDVISWWQDITDEIYREIPDFCGYLVKANSEGQPGPLEYNRTLAEGANLFAKSLEPYGGKVLFRAFIYDAKYDISNWKVDRASAGVDYFKGLDGDFHDNVVVQIKYGPLDFQVREPPSPLFNHLRKTNIVLELQVAQEYLGQQSHAVYLPPLWRYILDWDLRIDGKPSPVQDIVTGRTFGGRLSGFAGVANVGQSSTWVGSHLGMSNLFAYGRMAWDPTLDPESILREWSCLTFGHSQEAIKAITGIFMESWPAYLNYSSGDLGLNTLTAAGNHYGPDVSARDINGNGIWTRSDSFSFGLDRTVSNGTGHVAQYTPEVAQRFEKVESTPQELLLWFHHLNYTHELPSGKTIIQQMYDAHYAGAETAQTFPKRWMAARGEIDDERFNSILEQLQYQAGHSIVWRDSVCDYYRNLSGIPDEIGRVGNLTDRVEAESMTLEGYRIISLNPAESASNGSAITLPDGSSSGSAETLIHRETGIYDLTVSYFDVSGGIGEWEAHLNNRLIGKWKGDQEERLSHEDSDIPDGGSKTQITFSRVNVRKGDRLKIKGTGQAREHAALDYVSLAMADDLD